MLHYLMRVLYKREPKNEVRAVNLFHARLMMLCGIMGVVVFITSDETCAEIMFIDEIKQWFSPTFLRTRSLILALLMADTNNKNCQKNKTEYCISNLRPLI